MYLEISKDGGNNWSRVWDRVGRNQRKSQENVFLGFRTDWDLRVRLRSSLESTSSWWAIDNFYINATDLAYFPQIPPSGLDYSLNIGDSLNVFLVWQPGQGPPGVDRYRIQRKFGDSLSQYPYFTIGETGLDTLSFLDRLINENTEYSYRVGICEGPLHGLNSYPVTVVTDPVLVEPTSYSITYPKKFILKQNYPNPFNNSTSISFNFSENAKVKLIIYDSLGRQVKILFDKEFKSGFHTINFIADDLASGIYLYKIEGGGFSEVKKMILLK